MSDQNNKIKQRIKELDIELQYTIEQKKSLQNKLTHADIRVTQIVGALHELKQLLIVDKEVDKNKKVNKISKTKEK